MGPITIFILGGTAFVATLDTLFNPVYGDLKALEGKKQSEVGQMLKNATTEQWISGCLRYGCLWLLAMLLGFVLEPYFIIAALTTHTGNATVGYVALVIVAFGWIDFVRIMRRTSKKPTSAKVVTADGHRVEGMVAEIDEELPKVNWFTLNVRRVFYALPVVYLWYIFFVLLGALPQ